MPVPSSWVGCNPVPWGPGDGQCRTRRSFTSPLTSQCRAALPWEQSISKNTVSKKSWPPLTPYLVWALSGCFLLFPSCRLLPCLMSHLLATCLAHREQWGKRPVLRYGLFPLFILMSPQRQSGLGLKLPWNSLSLQIQPMSLGPWPLHVMHFIIKL